MPALSPGIRSPALSCSSDDMEMCSLKVLQPEGSPSRTLLRLMGERGCTTGHLVGYLQAMGNSEALQCLKPSGTRRTDSTGWLLIIIVVVVVVVVFGCCVVSNSIQLRNFSVLCSLAGSDSAPVRGDHVRPQSASELLCCGHVSGAVPVVQSQGWGELQSASTIKTIPFVNIIYLFSTSPGAKQHFSRPDEESSLVKRRRILHLQSQLWRCFRIQPVGSGGCPERRHVVRYCITTIPRSPPLPRHQVQDPVKVMTARMSLAHQGRVTTLQRVDSSWWSSPGRSGWVSAKTFSWSVALWDDQSLTTSGTEMESQFPTPQNENWWWVRRLLFKFFFWWYLWKSWLVVGSHKPH